MSNSNRTISVKIKAEVAGFKRAMDDAATSTDKTSAAFDKNGKKIETASGRMVRSAEVNRESWDRSGQSLVAFGAIGVAALGLSAKAAMNWEDAWTGVLKTVDGAPEQLGALEESLRSMALRIPASAEEIANVAAAAGQLGFKVDDVAKFTEVMINLGETTNLSADEAATSLARFMNVMGTSQDDADRLGSTIVDLGNNFATTESEIVAMAMRLSGAGKQIGLSEGEVLGLSTALSSVGIEAEAGGSAMSKVMIDIAASVDKGGERLDMFAKTSGMSSTAFAEQWKNDPAAALATFVSGLGDAEAQGGTTLGVLEELGITEVRMRDALLRASSASGTFTTAMDVGNKAFEANNALQTEAEKRYATTSSQMKLAKNALNEVAITVGSELLPALASMAGGLADAASAFADLPDPLRNVIVGFGGVISGVALLGGGLAFLLPRIKEMSTALRIFAASIGISSKAIKIAAISFGAIAAVLAVVAVAYTVFSSRTGDAAKANQELVDSLDDSTGALTANSRAIVYNALVESGAIDGAKTLGISLDTLTDAALGNAGAIDTVNAALDEHARLKGAGSSDEDIKAWMTNEAAARKVTEALGNQNAELNASKQAWKDSQEAMGGATDATKVQTAALEEEAAAQQASTEALDKWRDMVASSDASFIGLQDAYDGVIAKNTEWAQATADSTKSADDSWQTYYDGVTVSAADYIAGLQAQVEAQANWEQNILDITDRTKTGMTADMREAAFAMLDELMALGPDGAAQIQLLHDMTDDEFAKVVTLWGEKGAAAVAEFADKAEAYRQPEITPTVNMFEAGNSLNTWWRTQQAQARNIHIATSWSGGITRATGGPVFGAGTGTSDSIPARLSNGEHVWTAKEVTGAGGHAAVASLRSYAAKGFAEGGPVGSAATYITNTGGGGITAAGLTNAMAQFADRLGDRFVDGARTIAEGQVNTARRSDYMESLAGVGRVIG